MSIRQEVCEQVIYNVVITATATGCSKKFIEQIGERFNIREIAFDRWGVVDREERWPDSDHHGAWPRDTMRQRGTSII